VPAAGAYRARLAKDCALGQQIAQWQRSLEDGWADVRLGDAKVVARAGQHVFYVEVDLGDLDPAAVKVELYAEGTAGGPPARQEMRRVQQKAGVPATGEVPAAPATATYGASVPATRPASDYTVRVVPYFPEVAVPLEVNGILWQR